MIVDEVRIACPLGLEIPGEDVVVDHEFTLEVRVRVSGVRRDAVDVSGFNSEGAPASIPSSLALDLVAIPVDDWPVPAESPPTIAPDYAESAE